LLTRGHGGGTTGILATVERMLRSTPGRLGSEMEKHLQINVQKNLTDCEMRAGLRLTGEHAS